MLPDCRDYQLDAIACVGAKMRAGNKRVVLCMPTGSGKTRTCTEIGARYVATGSRGLWLAHRDELVDQGWRSLEAGGLSPGAISASSDLPRRPSPIQVASIQTLLANPAWLPPPEEVDFILADEAHHLGVGAEAWSALLGRYPDAYVVGPTATPERGDGTGLSPIFTAIVQSTDVPELSIRRLTARGVLVYCDVQRPSTFLRLTRNDDKNALAQDPVDAWCRLNSGEQGFIFFQTVHDAKSGCEELQRRGVLARYISGTTPKLERRAIIEGFKAGRIQCLCNVYVLTEGFDAPQASFCVLGRNCGTRGMLLQIGGRILRASPGKSKCTLIDLPGVTWVHGMLEDDCVWSLTGKASSIVSAGVSCPVCSKPVDKFPCSYCGHQPTGDLFSTRAASSTVVLDEPLTLYKRALQESPELRRESLERWVLGRIMQRKQPFWAAHRFKEVYGEPCPSDWYNTAVANALQHVRGTKVDPNRPEARRTGFDPRTQRRLYGVGSSR